MATTTSISAGIKVIKVSRTDSYGNDNTLSLQSLETLIIDFDDLGLVEFQIDAIAEYNTHYLYYVTPKFLGDMPTSTFPSPGDSSTGGSGGSGVITAGALVVGAYPNFTGPIKGFVGFNNVSSYTFNNGTGLFTSPNWIDPYHVTLMITSSLYSNSSAGGNLSLFVSSSTAGVLANTVIGTPANISGSSNATNFSASITFALPTSGSWVLRLGNYYGSNNFYLPTSSFTMSFSQYITSSSDLNGSLTVLEPYLTENFQYSDYNVLAGNAVEPRPNDFYMDVDYSSNQIIAVNENAILNGTAIKAPVQTSNYTTTGIITPRYIGKELQSAVFNEWTQGDIAFGKTPNVSNPKSYIVYFNWAGGTSPEWGNNIADRTAVNIKYIVDEEGNLIKPTNDSKGINLGIIRQTFEESGTAILGLNSDDEFGTNQAALNGEWPVFKSGYSIEPIIYSQTASYNTNGDINGYGYTGSIYFIQGDQGGNNTVNDYTLTTYMESGEFVDSNSSLPYVFNFNTPSILGLSASFNTGSDYYKPTGSIGSLSGSGVTLYLEAFIDALYYANVTATYAIQKASSGSGGIGTWSNLATFQIPHIAFTSGYINYTENNATTGSVYRVVCTTYQEDDPNGPYVVDYETTSYFKVTQSPNPNTGFCTSFWFTGSNGTNVLQASTGSGGLNTFYGQKQQDIDRSGFNPIALDFELQPFDEIRFGGTEDEAYQVKSLVTVPNLQLTLDRPITQNLNLSYFAVRRYVDNPTYVLLNVDKPAGGTSEGVLKPKYLTQRLQDSIEGIIENLQK
jgi:hypothetical protein